MMFCVPLTPRSPSPTFFVHKTNFNFKQTSFKFWLISPSKERISAGQGSAKKWRGIRGENGEGGGKRDGGELEEGKK
jgi:hypothetical protein